MTEEEIKNRLLMVIAFYTPDQLKRALKLIEKNRIAFVEGKMAPRVTTDNGVYRTTIHECTCPRGKIAGARCYHRAAVEMWILGHEANLAGIEV